MWANNANMPVDCGRRLLPTVIDQRARDEPDRAWCSLPVDDYDLSKGFEDISISRFANAINRLAWFIESTIGRSSTFETVAYLGVADIRYHILQMAVCKTGHKVLFSSQINTKEFHVSLLEQTDCKIFFSGLGVHVGDILAARPMKHVVIPDLEDLLDQTKAPHYPYEKTFEEAKNDPYLLLHTSGTTGTARPVVWNHAFIATQDRHLLLDEVAGRKPFLLLTHAGEGGRFLLTTSPPHAISAGFMMCLSVFGKVTIVPGFRHRGVNPDDLFELLPKVNCTKGVFTPWMMECIARRPDAERFIRPFDHVAFGGAVLSSFAADIWAKYTTIQNAWGATESLAAPQLTADKEDYAYVHFNTSIDGYEFRLVEDTGYVSEGGEAQDLYEFVMKITEESAPLASWHARQNIDLSTTPPPLPEWHTADLWTPHPDPAKKAYAWKFVCRRDDLISFSTGVNGHPAPLERALSSNEKVSAGLVCGAMHRQTVALIELGEEQEISQELASEIWDETLGPANTKMQTHMRVDKTHVLLFPSGSFPRTMKGSVIRKATEAKFSKEIEEIYEKFGDVWHDAKDRYGSISQTTSIAVEVVPKEEGTKYEIASSDALLGAQH